MWTWTPGETGFVTVEGVRLEAVCFGPPPQDAPTLVMLHEGLGSVSLWRDLPERLAQATGFGVFAWSRAGYGRSDPVTLPRPLDYMEREAGEGLGPLLDAIGFRRGVLLGHSDGASIAALYGGRVEDFRVRGLILIAPHFFTEAEGLASIAEARTAFESGDLREKLARHHADPDNAFRGWNGAWLDPRFEAWSIADTIDYWRVPVLAIQGEADQYGTSAQIEEIEARIYAPLDVLMLPGVGHSPHREAPEAVIEAVAGFCARLERIEAEPVAIPSAS